MGARGWLVQAALALSALGIAADVVIATRLGSSGTASFAASVVLGAPIVLAAGCRVCSGAPIRSSPAALGLLAAFVGWSAMTIFWSADQGAVVSRVITDMQLLALVWFGWQLVASEDALRATLGGFLAGCVLIVLLTWQSFVAGNAFEDVVFEGGTRYAAQGFDPNDMAVTLALGIPMAVYLAVAARSHWRWLMLLYLPLAGSGIALSASRGGTLAAAVGLAGTLVWLGRRSRVALTLTLALVAAGTIVVGLLVPWETWSRLLTIREELGGTVSDRDVIWRVALILLAGHPFVGVGAAGFPSAALPALTPWRNPPVPYVHNTPLSVAVELGGIGLLLFLGVFAAIFQGIARGAANHRALITVLALTWFVGCASLTWEARKGTWFVLLLGIAVGGLRRGEAQ